MKTINFAINEVENVVENAKVSAAFVQELKEAFSMSPIKTDMRFKQSSKGELIISVTFAYDTGMKQHLEGAGDSDLITAINFCMAKITKLLDDYKAEEHEVDTAKDGENLVMELFKQHINSPIYGYIEKDWYNNYGERYRCVRFSPTPKGNVKFCMKATLEVNNLISEACKPESTRRDKLQVPEQNEVA